MKIMLVVQRESADLTADAWVEDVIDEYVLDGGGELPAKTSQAMAEDGENFRTLWVEIPDDAITGLWDTPTVTGTVLS